MSKHDRDPSLSKSIDRRAKIAALASSVLLPGLIAELANARPAGAETESGAQAMITTVNHDLENLQSQIKSARGHKYYYSKVQALEFYQINVPSPGHRGHHDVLGMEIKKGSKMPESLTVILNAESPKEAQEFKFTHGDPNNTVSDPNVVVLYHTQVYPGLKVTSYRLANNRSSLPTETEYLDNPSAVTKEFNYALSKANTILKEDS